MRVALLTYSTRPRGGVVHTLHLAESLAEVGVDVHVWTLGRGGDTTFFRPVDPRVQVHAVPFPDPDEDVGARILRSIDVLAEAFAAGPGYDVVHAQDCISANAALRVGRCLRTVHHLDSFTTPALVACHERAVREPDGLVCVSAAVAAEVEAEYGRTPAVIPNGVAAARFESGARDVAGRARWQDVLGRYVLALGGIEPRKGSLDLLSAMATLRARRSDLADVRLVYAGGETLFDYRDYRARFEALSAEVGVVPEILGPVDDDVLPSLLAQAEVLPFLSTKEGFGLAALEALAAGTAVVARDLPVLREVLGGTVTYGHDVETFADALERALDAPPPVGPGRDLARGYSWQAAATAHLDVYRRLSDRPR
ncbi:MSMEG_0565 family glycosyltransferase [Nocardioides bruguierae]|uniref:MSMEG_0565 family glycosyltransferase n=1 Tax=Nocardioides bruguierae TaxID=2945102 RepID=UPI0020222851|nr:MSMEG_0565 family glycosyltransferase [Nocardioides bruguierae]MCL8026875.1 MSMEG_0565 family glycosyltransferase [Nocardioides bruguierae]